MTNSDMLVCCSKCAHSWMTSNSSQRCPRCESVQYKPPMPNNRIISYPPGSKEFILLQKIWTILGRHDGEDGALALVARDLFTLFAQQDKESRQGERVKVLDEFKEKINLKEYKLQDDHVCPDDIEEVINDLKAKR